MVQLKQKSLNAPVSYVNCHSCCPRTWKGHVSKIVHIQVFMDKRCRCAIVRYFNVTQFFSPALVLPCRSLSMAKYVCKGAGVPAEQSTEPLNIIFSGGDW